MTNKINWQTAAATNGAGSRAAALALANRLATVIIHRCLVGFSPKYRQSICKRQCGSRGIGVVGGSGCLPVDFICHCTCLPFSPYITANKINS